MCSHNDLQKKRGSLQEEIRRLEMEQEQLIQAKEKELLDQACVDTFLPGLWICIHFLRIRI